jgi:hypothetical protein
MIDRQEARSDVARIDPAADRWLHTANRARATTDPRVGRLVKSHCFEPIDSRNFDKSSDRWLPQNTLYLHKHYQHHPTFYYNSILSETAHNTLLSKIKNKSEFAHSA